MATGTQKLTVALAFAAAALSFAAVGIGFYRGGGVPTTPLLGGLFMLALGVGGYLQLRDPQHRRK